MKKRTLTIIGMDIKSTWVSFAGAFLNVAIFEGIYKLLTLVVFSPIIDKIFVYVGNPTSIGQIIVSIFLGIVFVIIGVLVTFFEFAVILTFLNGARRTGRIPFFHGLLSGLRTLRNLLHPSTLGLAIYLLGLIPLLRIGIQSSFLPGIYIPDFIIGEISKWSIGWIALDAFIYLPLIIFVLMPFVLPLMILENDSFSAAIKKNFQLLKKNIIRIIVNVGVYLLIIYTFTQFINFVTATTIPLIYTAGGLIIDVLQILSTPLLLSALMTSTPINFSDVESTYTTKSFSTHFFKRYNKPIIILLILAIFAITYINTSNFYFLKSESYIIGHRGSLKDVENSIPAVLGAAEEDADYAEIDVLLSKDGIPMVIHDTNLLRLTGKMANIGDLTAEEVTKLEQTLDDKKDYIPTLEALCEKSKGKIRLLVELKSHGKETVDVVDTVMDVLKRTGVYNDSIFQTQDEQMIDKIKKEYKGAKVGLVVVLSLSDMQEDTIANTPADFLSVEESVFDDKMVEIAHGNNKEVFVWTVNQENEVMSLLRSGVDGIITDYPKKVRITMENMM